MCCMEYAKLGSRTGSLAGSAHHPVPSCNPQRCPPNHSASVKQWLLPCAVSVPEVDHVVKSMTVLLSTAVLIES